MDENSKRRMMARYLRGQKKIVGRDEEKRRRDAAAARRQARRDGRPRRREWSDDEAAFEKIPRQRRVAAPGLAPGTDQLVDLPQAVVAAVHQGRVVLEDGRTARVAGHLLVDPEFRLAVGDVVRLEDTDGPPRIAGRGERRTCLSRPDPGNPHRTLVVAANVDLAVVVVAVQDPPLRPGLIDRLLLALRHGGVAPVVCVNKDDLLPTEVARAAARELLAPYADLGCPVFWCSARSQRGIDALRERLRGQTCVFVGHSGVGKSSILNALDPDGDRSTGDVRARDGRGRHTTTSASLRRLPDGTRVIDTPGVRAFGLDRLGDDEILAAFPEIARAARGCRFTDCSHDQEPDCAVRDAVANGALSARRFASFRRLVADP